MKKIERIGISDLEKMTQSKYICTQKLKLSDENIFKDNKKRVIEFDIFNGFAYGIYSDPQTKEDKELYMIYPQKEFIKASKNMDAEIREFCGLNDTDEITETHILITYSTLCENVYEAIQA